jgi:hypothetical protein
MNVFVERGPSDRFSRRGRAKRVILTFVVAALVARSFGTDAPQRKVDGIADNSFLVEEGYNQESGVVQHILSGFWNLDKLSGVDDERCDLSFTQEWPLFSMTHQLSYTVPYSFTWSGQECDNGIGDVLLNYRYQALFREETLTAFAPRLSLILPTGDGSRGLGEDAFGGQLNLPFSTAIGDEWFLHLNAGGTFLPDAVSANDRDLWHYNLGASVIYAVTYDLHLLVEWIAGWTEGPNAAGDLHHEFSSLISPGVRKAFNFTGGAQMVAGIAAPIGLTRSAPDYGLFLYLSFEHSFKRTN